jgi:polysaccharide biosynthesis transport protein
MSFSVELGQPSSQVNMKSLDCEVEVLQFQKYPDARSWGCMDVWRVNCASSVFSLDEGDLKMESMSILGLPYFPDWTDDESSEFTRSSPESTAASAQPYSPNSPTLIHKRRSVALSRNPVTNYTDRLSVHSSNHPQRQVAVAAGVAIAVTAGAVGLSQAPVYEGSVQLAVQAAMDSSRYAPTAQAKPSIAAPEFSAEVLTSRLLLDPIVRQIPHLTYQSLVENLTLTSENGLVSLRYRDADPQRVQLVLAQVAQAYVDHGQSCQGDTCQSAQNIEDQISRSRMRHQKLSTEMEQLRQEYGVNNFQAQLKRLEDRTADVIQQESQLQETLAAGQRDYRQLRQQISGELRSSSGDIVPQLLSDRYRSLLFQFQALDQQLGNQFVSMGGGDLSDLRAVQSQHQRVMNQLVLEAQSVLPQNSTSAFPDGMDLQLLQQSILTFNSVQIMQARQVTLSQAKQNLEQQRSQLLEFLGQYNDLRQQLDRETNTLQLHLQKLETLQSQPATLKVTDEPDMIRDQQGQPIAMIPNLPRNLGIAAALGVLAGVSVSAVMERKRLQSTNSTEVENVPVDVLLNRAKELADMKLRSQFAQTA